MPAVGHASVFPAAVLDDVNMLDPDPGSFYVMAPSAA